MKKTLNFDNGASYVTIESDDTKTIVTSGYKRGIGCKKVEGEDFNKTVWKHYWTVIVPIIKTGKTCYQEYEEWVKKEIKPEYKIAKKIDDCNGWVKTTINWELYSNKVQIESYNRDGWDTTEGSAKTIDDFRKLLKEHEEKIDGWGTDNFKKFVKTWDSLRNLDN